MKGLRLGIAVWLLLRALLLGAVPLFVQAELPQLEARVAWNGYERGTWSDVLVMLEQGSLPWRGELLLVNEQEVLTYRLPVELPTQARKPYRLLVFLGNETHLKLALRSAQGVETIVSKLFFTHLDDKERLCGAVGVQISAFPVAWAKSFLADLSFLPESGPACLARG